MMTVTLEQVSAGRISVDAGGQKLIVDRDAEDGTKMGFRPVELLLAALGACTAGTMISFAENQGIELSGVRLRVDGETASHPERVASIVVDLEIPGDLDEAKREQLLRVAKHCKIHNTLRSEPEVEVRLLPLAEAVAPAASE